MMKISKVAYENAPPYVRFLPKWGYVRLYRIKIDRKSVREVNCTWRLRSWHFFPWRSHHGPTRGWYGNVTDIQNSVKGFSQPNFMSKFFEKLFFQNEVTMSPISGICWCGTHKAHISHFPLPLKTPPRWERGGVRGTCEVVSSKWLQSCQSER